MPYQVTRHIDDTTSITEEVWTEEEIQAHNQALKQAQQANNTWLLILLCIFFPPLGIAVACFWALTSKSTWIVLGLIIVLVGGLLAIANATTYWSEVTAAVDFQPAYTLCSQLGTGIVASAPFVLAAILIGGTMVWAVRFATSDSKPQVLAQELKVRYDRR